MIGLFPLTTFPEGTAIVITVELTKVVGKVVPLRLAVQVLARLEPLIVIVTATPT